MFDVLFYVISYLPILLLLNFAVAIHILLNKREESVSAVMWLLIVFFFPIFGILFYLFFGINRLKTLGIKINIANELMRSQRFDPIHRGIKCHIDEQRKYIFQDKEFYQSCGHYNFSLDRMLPETMPLTGNRVELLFDGTMAYPKMLEAIKNATKNIHLQSYIIMNDEVGKIILDALEERARNGIDVKVMYDSFGSWRAITGHFFKKYAQGIPNMRVSAFTHGNLLAPWRIQLRNHRKLLVIDSSKAFIGGVNISNDNDRKFSHINRHIHDLHCFVEGPEVGELQFSFLRDWHYATKTPPAELFKEDYFPLLEACGDSIMRMVASGPGQSYEATAKVFFTAASSAKRYIWIMTPYFVPSRSFQEALRMAVARGVEVRLLLPRTNNHFYVYYATQALYSRLLEHGVKIFEKTGPFVHAKAMLVDGEWAYMGSSNCDNRSFRLNYELDFAISKGQFIDDLHSQLVQQTHESQEIKLENILNKPLHRELIESVCALMNPIL